MPQSSSVRAVPADDFEWYDASGPAAEVRAVVDASTETDGIEPLNEAALLTLRHRGLDGSALYLSGSAGFAWVHDDEVELVVTPEARDLGVGAALADAVVEAHPDATLSAWSHGNHPAAAALAEKHGFARVRDLWVMRRSLNGLPELASRDDVVVRAFVPGQDDDAFLALNAEAFAGHPEQGQMTESDLAQRMAEPWFDAAGFLVAVPPEDPTGLGARRELLGFHWTKVHEGPSPHGEVYVVGVSPRAQGRGLGRLLTLSGLHHLADRGLDEVILYVEADNVPAIRTYEGLGFTHTAADTHVMYARNPDSSAR